jgi:hypothetical protein
MDGHISPLLNIRFGIREAELVVYRADGSRFLSFQELNERAANAIRLAETERRRAETEQQRANAAETQLQELKERLRAAGIDPDALP